MKWITMILYALEIIYLNVLALSLNSIVLLENKLRLVAKGIFQTPGNPLKKLYKTSTTDMLQGRGKKKKYIYI